VIFCGVSLILLLIFYFPPHFHMINSRMTKIQEIKDIDYGGLVLYAAGLTLLMLAFSKQFHRCTQRPHVLISLPAWGQGTYKWTNAHVLATLLTGVATLVAFGLYGESRDIQSWRCFDQN